MYVEAVHDYVHHSGVARRKRHKKLWSFYVNQAMIFDFFFLQVICLLTVPITNRPGPWNTALFFPLLAKHSFDFPLFLLSNLFFMKTSKGFQDGHIWYSVFSRSPRSSFTRAQRVSCCFSLLLCTMLTSIMFWGVPKDPAEQKMDLGNNRYRCLGRKIERQQNLEVGQLDKWAFS